MCQEKVSNPELELLNNEAALKEFTKDLEILCRYQDRFDDFSSAIASVEDEIDNLSGLVHKIRGNK